MKLNFAENLRTLRRKNDLTQEQLADRLAVSVQTVSRWENEITYPDVEMLPVIAEMFDTTVDDLLGTAEALKEREISRYWDRLNRTDSNKERTEIFREAHRALPRELSFTAMLCESMLYSDDPVHNPEALEEMRALAEDVLTNSRDTFERERTASALIRAEDEEQAEKLLELYAAGERMTRSRLLMNRYEFRGEDEKARYITQEEAAERLFDMLLFDLNDPSDDCDEKIRAYKLSFDVLDTLTGCTDPNPVSGDGVPDAWCRLRIHAGNRLAAWHAKKGDREAMYAVLEDNVALFEKVCSLPEGTKLDYRTPGLSSLKYEVEHAFSTQPNSGPDFGKLYKTTYFKPIDPPIQADTPAFFPTTYTWALTDSDWAAFDGVRNEQRFQALAKRMTDAIETKDPE